MSYILEALRRAESERERGLVPGLNAQPLGPADGEQAFGTARLRTWAPWAIAGVAVLVAGVLAWTWRTDAADRRVAAVEAQLPASVPAAPVFAPAAPVTIPSPAPTSPTAPTAATTASPDVPAAGTRLAATARVPAPARPASVGTAPAAVQPSSASGPVAAPAVTEQRVYGLAELPDATRRELPSLSVAGASYSERPANRLLIVNGNVFHEGDRLAPDLVLEHIDLKSAVLQFKGVRFSMTY